MDIVNDVPQSDLVDASLGYRESDSKSLCLENGMTQEDEIQLQNIITAVYKAMDSNYFDHLRILTFKMIEIASVSTR